jgi:hypothetical protein
MPKMRIFNRLDELEFDSPPKFNSAERKKFFALSMALEELLESPRTTRTNKVFFVVSLGYFKARKRFFARQFLQTDIEFVANQLNVPLSEIDLESYSKVTYLRHQQLILSHLGYSKFDENFAKSEIQSLVRIQYRPKIMLLELLESLARRKMVIPTYNQLCELIINAFNHHEKILSQTVFNSLNENQRLKLDSFLQKEDENVDWSYRLTLFKKTYQSTKPLKIKANLDDLKALQQLYVEFHPKP